MLIIGLSGGIASGKSTATDFFLHHDVPVIDADRIVHKLIQAGTPTCKSIIAEFGDDIVQADGELDRKKLREIIFSDSKQRLRLESIIHPEVRKTIAENISQLDAAFCIVCIPLLVETGQQDLVDRVLIIDVDESTQRQRLQARDNIEPGLVDKILAAQASRDERLAVADDVILNNSDKMHFESELLRLHTKYQQLSEKPAKTEF